MMQLMINFQIIVMFYALSISDSEKILKIFERKSKKETLIVLEVYFPDLVKQLKFGMLNNIVTFDNNNGMTIHRPIDFMLGK